MQDRFGLLTETLRATPYPTPTPKPTPVLTPTMEPIPVYVVTFIANTGILDDDAEMPPTITKEAGEALVLQTVIPRVDGYRFVNWNSRPDGSGSTFANGAVYDLDASVTLYAQWEALPTPVPATPRVQDAFDGFPANPVPDIVDETGGGATEQ